MHLLLVRHGETDWNAAGKIQGCTDTPLNARGRAQALALAGRLRGERPQRLYTSPLRRARETAAIVGAELALEPETVEALREISFGEWEGCSWEEIQRRWPREFAWCEGDRLNRAPPGGESYGQLMERAPPGGESYGQLMERALPAVEAIRRAPGGTAVAVCHSAVIRAVLCALEGMSIGEGYRRLRIKNSSVSELADLSGKKGD